MMEAPINILLVDDHRTTNILNKLLLQKRPSIQSVFTASSIIKAQNIIKRHLPEIILIDKDLILTNEVTVYDDLKRITENKSLIILLSSDHLAESNILSGLREYTIPEIKFKVLTKTVVAEILKTYYNKHIVTASE